MFVTQTQRTKEHGKRGGLIGDDGREGERWTAGGKGQSKGERGKESLREGGSKMQHREKGTHGETEKETKIV